MFTLHGPSGRPDHHATHLVNQRSLALFLFKEDVVAHLLANLVKGHAQVKKTFASPVRTGKAPIGGQNGLGRVQGIVLRPGLLGQSFDAQQVGLSM
jgi:hypothetical protein